MDCNLVKRTMVCFRNCTSILICSLIFVRATCLLHSKSGKLRPFARDFISPLRTLRVYPSKLSPLKCATACLESYVCKGFNLRHIVKKFGDCELKKDFVPDRKLLKSEKSSVYYQWTEQEPYNYMLVLELSILFYESLRSGDLPEDRRLLWTQNSGLNDSSSLGEDLTGGWYDGDLYVKYNYPMAFSVTLLAWGLVEFREAYKKAEQLENALASIKWALDYMLRCHTENDKLYIQVGNYTLDSATWSRASDMNPDRPASHTKKYFVNGPDIAGEFSAAMALASMAFNETDPGYSRTLLEHADVLFKCSRLFTGTYTKLLPDTRVRYGNTDYFDERVWSALWMHVTTGNSSYNRKLRKAHSLARHADFSFPNKYIGNQYLFYIVETRPDRRLQNLNALKKNIQSWIDGTDGKQYTPKGLAWRRDYGALHYSANMAFLAMVVAKHNVIPDKALPWARQQILYMLGDGGRSYVVGFGKDPPQRPRHQPASCPLPPDTCDWDDYRSALPNPHVAYGALVAGPDQFDRYSDIRDSVQNEVQPHFNAGFQSAIAALIVYDEQT